MVNRWMSKLTLTERRKYNHEQHLRLTLAAQPRRCIICGKPFKSRRKPVKVCGPRCRAHLTGFAKTRLTAEQQKRATTHRLLHPRTGPFETNNKAKYWSLLCPSRDVYQFWNMSFFVRKHKYLFHAEDIIMQGENTLAAQQLRRLRPDRKTPLNSWKGWQWYYAIKQQSS